MPMAEMSGHSLGGDDMNVGDAFLELEIYMSNRRSESDLARRRAAHFAIQRRRQGRRTRGPFERAVVVYTEMAPDFGGLRPAQEIQTNK